LSYGLPDILDAYFIIIKDTPALFNEACNDRPSEPYAAFIKGWASFFNHTTLEHHGAARGYYF
jgi:hypothetical protein